MKIVQNKKILLLLLLLFFFNLFFRGYSKDKPDNIEFCFGGLTFGELMKCDSSNFVYIADKEIYLLNSKSNMNFKIDSLVLGEFIPFNDVNIYKIKGNKFPLEISQQLLNYKVGIGIVILKAYYNNEKQEFKCYENDQILLICGKEFLMQTKPAEYRPGW